VWVEGVGGEGGWLRWGGEEREWLTHT